MHACQQWPDKLIEVADGFASLFDDLPEIDQFLDEEEEEDNDMNRIHNPQDLGHIQCSLPPDEEGRWMLVSFGLRNLDIGRKDMWLSRLSLQQIKEAVWTLWQDETPQFATITTYFVGPQPIGALELQHALVVLVAIETDSDTNLLRPVLSVDLNRDGTLIRRPKAVYTPLYSTFEQLHEIHLDHFLCSPQGFRRCTLSLRDVVIPPGYSILVVAGGVNQLAWWSMKRESKSMKRRQKRMKRMKALKRRKKPIKRMKALKWRNFLKMLKMLKASTQRRPTTSPEM